MIDFGAGEGISNGEKERESKAKPRQVCLAQFGCSFARDDEDIGSDCRTERRDCLCREGFFFIIIISKLGRENRTGLL